LLREEFLCSPRFEFEAPLADIFLQPENLSPIWENYCPHLKSLPARSSTLASWARPSYFAKVSRPRGQNGRYRLVGLLQQSVFGRFAGYEDANDADRLWPRFGDALGGRRPSDHRVCCFRPSQMGGTATKRAGVFWLSSVSHRRTGWTGLNP